MLFRVDDGVQRFHGFFVLADFDVGLYSREARVDICRRSDCHSVSPLEIRTRPHDLQHILKWRYSISQDGGGYFLRAL